MKLFSMKPLALLFVCLAPGALVAAEREAPLITPAEPASLQAACTAAIASGAKRLVIPPGIYQLAPAPGNVAHVLLEKAHDLEIDGRGATLVFGARDKRGLSLRDCQRVTVRGLRLERAKLPFSQGRIERLEEDGRWCVVRIDGGYPQDIDDRRFFPTFWTNVFTLDRQHWLAHYRGQTPTIMQRLAPDLLRVQMNTLPAQVSVPLGPGTPLAWRGEVFDDVEMRSSEDCTIDGVTVAGGAGMCFHERGGGGNRYLDCAVVRPAAPQGAVDQPLLASCADGFHSSGATRGPRLERCSFTALDDDAIAIHGTYAMIVEARQKTLIVWRLRWEENALYGAVGDQIRVYDAQRVRAGEARITAVRKLDGYALAASPDPAFTVFKNPAEGVFLEIACDTELAAAPGWLISNPGCAGPGYVIRDCVIRDTFARGILAKGDRGLIEGNLIERTARAGIEFNPELALWSENDYATDVVVRGNTLRSVSLNRQVGELRHPGAMTMFAYRAGAYVPAPGGHRQVLIEGNTFIDNDGPNLLITSALGVSIRGNHFVRPMQTASLFGKDKGVDASALLWLAACAEVSCSDNRIEAAGPGMAHVFATGVGVSNSNIAAGFHITQP